MRKEQLDLLSLAARDGVGPGPCDRRGLVTSGFISTVIVSAYGDMANIRTAMNRGAFDFLTKPDQPLI